MPSDANERRQKDAAVERIVEQRRKQLEEENMRAAERLSLQRAQRAGEREAMLAELDAAQGRSTKREAWRQERHARLLEEEKERQRKAEERRLASEQERRRLEEQERQRQYLDELHARASFKKRTERRAQAMEHEEMEKKTIDHRTERELQDLAARAERTLAFLEHAMRHDLDQCAATAEKRRREATLRAELLTEELKKQQDSKGSGAQKKITTDSSGGRDAHARLERSRTRIALDLKHQLEKIDADLRQQTERIERAFRQKKEEFQRRNAKETAGTKAQADRRLREAEIKREREEERLGFGEDPNASIKRIIRGESAADAF